MKRIIILIISILFLTGCGKEVKNPIVTMEIGDYGSIEIELYPKYAKNTVANFVSLVESGFYDNNSFHRYVEDFVLQGGDPLGNGTGGPGYSIYGEFILNGYSKNTLKHEKGVVSMARANDYDSAGSQFFIVLDTSSMVSLSLDEKYAAFGKVTKGYEVIEKICEDAQVENDVTGKLKENIVIKKAMVETFGGKYEVKKV